MTGLTLDGWLFTKKEQYRDKIVKDAINNGILKKEAAETGMEEAQKATEMLQTKLNVSSEKIDSSTKEVNDYFEKISQISTQVTNGNGTLNPQELEVLKTNQEIYREAYIKAVAKQDAAIKELQALSSSSDPDIVKSDFSGFFTNFFDNFREFISVLSSEQMVIIINLLGYIVLTQILITITSVLIGDNLINLFKLDTKYPKLAKYIRFKQTIKRYKLNFYILNLYLVIILLVTVNIFMFTYEYL